MSNERMQAIQQDASGGGSRGGMTPSQTRTDFPMPTDLLTAQNSQLVFVVAELGYDFITDARRDYYVQQFRDMSKYEEFMLQPVSPGDNTPVFERDLNLPFGPVYLPEDNRAMCAMVSPGPLTGEDGNYYPLGYQGTELAGIMWILLQEGQPLYALRLRRSLAAETLKVLSGLLYDQTRVDESMASDRVSVAGRIIREITLYNGQMVPLLDVSLGGLTRWNKHTIIRDVLAASPDTEDKLAQAELDNFLRRLYSELRNMGQSPSDRAINYLATNAWQANEVIVEAAKGKYVLDGVYAEKSPLFRPKSDCWDVIMRFLVPNKRKSRAVVEHRQTVDVNDLVPIGIGKMRSWTSFGK